MDSIHQQSDNILILMSGGPDSAYALKYYLSETDKRIYTLNTQLHNHVPSYGGMSVKCTSHADSIIDYCTELYRPVHRLYGGTFLPDIGKSKDLVAMFSTIAHVVSGGPDISEVISGTCQDDNDASQRIGNRIDQTMQELLNAAAGQYNTKAPEFKSVPGYTTTKQQVREYLGEQLWALTWSCRNPVECGECWSCKNRNKTHAIS